MRNTFRRQDVIERVAAQASQGMRATEILALTDEFLSRTDLVVELVDGRYSTHDLIAAERARESAQLNRIDERAGIASTRGLKAANAFSLNSGQREVVEAVFTSGNGVDVIESQAGVGKTFTAGAIRAVAEQDGRRVIGTAPTAVAALELQEQAGIESAPFTASSASSTAESSSLAHET